MSNKKVGKTRLNEFIATSKQNGLLLLFLGILVQNIGLVLPFYTYSNIIFFAEDIYFLSTAWEGHSGLQTIFVLFFITSLLILIPSLIIKSKENYYLGLISNSLPIVVFIFDRLIPTNYQSGFTLIPYYNSQFPAIGYYLYFGGLIIHCINLKSISHTLKKNKSPYGLIAGILIIFFFLICPSGFIERITLFFVPFLSLVIKSILLNSEENTLVTILVVLGLIATIPLIALLVTKFLFKIPIGTIRSLTLNDRLVNYSLWISAFIVGLNVILAAKGDICYNIEFQLLLSIVIGYFYLIPAFSLLVIIVDVIIATLIGKLQKSPVLKV